MLRRALGRLSRRLPARQYAASSTGPARKRGSVFNEPQAMMMIIPPAVVTKTPLCFKRCLRKLAHRELTACQ